MRFPVSGIDAPLWLPPLVAFVISYFSSMGGISGAVLLLPFQMSVLGFTSPAVSPTNLVFNIVAIPSGVYRYVREGRMITPLTWMVVAGTLPGVVAGSFMRFTWLPGLRTFKLFVGCVLLYVGSRLLSDARRTVAAKAQAAVAPAGQTATPGWAVRTLEFDLRHFIFEFQGQRYQATTTTIVLLSFTVGIVGGIYGIGGGAILAPFFVTICGLPVHTIAGATLLGTFLTSIVGVGCAQLAAPFYETSGIAVAPDWPLGLLFGIGGAAGMYLGARTQRFVPARRLKVMLGVILAAVACSYLAGYFFF